MSNNILIYDIKSFPHDIGLSMEQIIQLFKEQKVVIWDSHNEGHKPEVINIEDIEVTFIDVSKQEQFKKLNNYKEKIK